MNTVVLQPGYCTDRVSFISRKGTFLNQSEVVPHYIQLRSNWHFFIICGFVVCVKLELKTDRDLYIYASSIFWFSIYLFVMVLDKHAFEMVYKWYIQ